MAWEHSGFSVDNKVHVGANAPEGYRQLARHMIRNPFSLEKMEYKVKQGMVVYRSRHHATLKRNLQIMPGAAGLKLLLQHVPDPDNPDSASRGSVGSSTATASTTVEEDWPDNSQIPLTYHPVPDIV